MARSSSVSVKSKSSSRRQLRLQPRHTSARGADMVALGQVLLEELAPQTALQRSVAQNLVDNELDRLMLRDRKSLIFWEEAARAMQRLLSARLENDAACALARAWAAGVAEAEIEALDIDPEIALNAAYFETFQFVAMMDTQIDRLERRRRQLHDDLTRLKVAMPITSAIPEAELVEGEPHVC